MKKPITIGVIAVIATILVTSAVDFSAIGAKPTNEVYAQGSSRGNGEFVCPDGSTKVSGNIFSSFSFSETEDGNRGQFSMFTQNTNPQRSVSSTLWAGNVDSGSYLFKGVGNENQPLGNLCGTMFLEPDEFTVWGKCGHDVVINFEMDSGISGTTTGTVVCV